MMLSRDVYHDFLDRVARIPIHGLGLSVDVYSPDLISLLAELTRRQVFPGYLEVFHATSSALAAALRPALSPSKQKMTRSAWRSSL